VRRLQERGALTALTAGRGPVLVTVAVAAVVAVADQATTSWALHSLHHPEHVWGPFGLDLQFNRGSAFNLLDGTGWLAEVLAVVTLAVVAVLAWHARSTVQRIGFGLVVGGAVGNLGDRWFRSHHGAVVDYVTLSHWPTFNVADACITIGVIVVALSLVAGPRAQAGGGSERVVPAKDIAGVDATGVSEAELADAARMRIR
jgi:signal peptidase II